jgi:hypothetical protein
VLIASSDESIGECDGDEEKENDDVYDGDKENSDE